MAKKMRIKGNNGTKLLHFVLLCKAIVRLGMTQTEEQKSRAKNQVENFFKQLLSKYT